MVLSLITLPVELIYRILDHLDDGTIYISCRDVCVRLNTIVDTYHRYQTLSKLDLAHKLIDDHRAEQIANFLQQSKTLTTLYLDNNQIGPEGTKHLANVLQHNTTLVILGLWSNHIGDQGAQYLAMALEQNSTLKTLDLRSNNITDEGATYFYRTISNYSVTRPRLVRLDLNLNGIYIMLLTLIQCELNR